MTLVLQQIKATSCPHCSSKVRSASKSNQHCNGFWNEQVVFDCGYALEWSPNFMAQRETKPCTKTAEYSSSVETKNALIRVLIATVEKSTVDVTFKQKLVSNLTSHICF